MTSETPTRDDDRCPACAYMQDGWRTNCSHHMPTASGRGGEVPNQPTPRRAAIGDRVRTRYGEGTVVAIDVLVRDDSGEEDLYGLSEVAAAAGGAVAVPADRPAESCERCDELEQDVLTAWRVRNAALAVAASFVLPGPDGQDYADRRALVEEWVGDGHDAVKEHDRQLAEAMRQLAEARAALGEPEDER